jgi:uncharacterized membrane protein YqjE
MKRDIARAAQESENLPTLFSRLASDTTELLDAKLALLKIELKEEAATYIRNALMIIIGAVVALIGFGLLNVAIAFLVSTVFNGTMLSQPVRYGLGFIITAVIYLILGLALSLIGKNKIAQQDILPERSVAELKRDKQALETEL